MAHLTVVPRNFVSAVLGVSFAIAMLFVTTAALAEGDVSSALKPAPDWELKSLKGKVVKLSEFRGKVVILDFWATWCAPCRKEIPGFVDLQKEYGRKGLTVIGVSLDQQGMKTVKEFVKQFAMTYPIVMANEKTIAAYGGIEGVPTTFVIDRQGRIVSEHLGYEAKETFEKEIQSLL